jgi:hypothetical protein
MYRAHRRGLFSGAQPRLGDDALAYPALEHDVMEPGAQKSGVEREPGLAFQRLDDAGSLRILRPGFWIRADQRGIRFPVDVFRGIEGGEASQNSLCVLCALCVLCGE